MISLPERFPRDVAAFACDLDGTLIGRDATLTAATVAAVTRARAAGVPTLVATGRMFRSVRPYLEQLGIGEPVVCYQGAVVADPRSGEFLLHEPIDLAVAREAIELLQAAGFSPNVYVDDELYVSAQTETSRAYASFQHLPVFEVGDLLAWLDRPPTKLVAVGDPDVLREVRVRATAALGDRLFVTTSLSNFLELGRKGISKGTGLREACARLGVDPGRVVAFGDGENDVELLEAAGYGVAVEGSHRRLADVADATCPGPAESGVAQVIEAVLAAMPSD